MMQIAACGSDGVTKRDVILGGRKSEVWLQQTSVRKKTVEDIVRKEENAGNKHFLSFLHTVFCPSEDFYLQHLSCI